MKILDYEKMREDFKNVKYMLDNIENLEDFEVYHYLLPGSEEIANEICNKYNIKNKEFKKWLKYCDGGMLFDTVLLSKQAYDKETDIEFDSYDEYNEDKSLYDLEEKYCIIGVRSYGDIICVNTEEVDGQIYLLNLETGEFDDIWCTFEDWLTEEIDDAIGLIADDVLEPIDAKLEEFDDDEDL